MRIALAAFLLAAVEGSALPVLTPQGEHSRGSCEAEVLAPGKEARGRLQSGGPPRCWRLELGGDQLATVDVRVDGAGVTARLRDPGGGAVRALHLAPGATETTSISWVSAAPGAWTLELEATEPGQAAGCHVRCTVVRKASDRDRDLWEAELLDQRVSDSLDLGEIPVAIELARQVRDRKMELLRDDRASQARYLQGLGLRLFDAPASTPPAWEEAGRILAEALGLRERVFGADSLQVAETLDTLSTLRFFQGRHDEAAALLERLVSIRRVRLGAHDSLVAEALNSLAVMRTRQGLYSEADRLLVEALGLMRAPGPAGTAPAEDPSRTGGILNSLAELRRTQHRFKEAEGLFREALAMLEPMGEDDNTQLTRLLNNLAGLLKDEGRYDEAEVLLRRSLQLRESSQPDDVVATALLNLAELHRLQGNTAGAEPLYVRALEMTRRSMGPDNPELAWFINQLAVLRQGQGKLDEAEALYREALALLEGTLGPEDLLVAQTLHDLGSLTQSRGQREAAAALHQRALAIRRRAYGEGHPDVAVSLIHLSQPLAQTPGAGPAAAFRMLDEAIGILEATSAYPESEAEAYSIRARLSSRAGDRDSAISSMQGSIRIVEGLRAHSGGGEATRADFLGKYLTSYRELSGWLLDAGRVAEAFDFSERARGRALLDQLAAAQVDLRDQIPPDIRSGLEARESALTSRMAEVQQRAALLRSRADLPRPDRARQIGSLETELAAAGREYRQLYEEIKNASPLWRRSSGGDPVGLAETQRRLMPPGGLMLVYLIGPERSHVIAIPPGPDRAESHRLSVPSEAAAALEISAGDLRAAELTAALLGAPRDDGTVASGGLLQRLSRPPGEDHFDGETEGAAAERCLHDRLEALGRVLIPEALWPRIRSASEVILIPDGALSHLPFEALVAGAASTAVSGRYWLDEGPPLRYAVSATLLRELERRSESSRGAAAGPALLTVSDPIYDRARQGSPPAAAPGGPPVRSQTTRPLERLPGTAREAAEILRHFGAELPAARIRSLQGLEATELSVRAALGGVRYLHLAAHGIVDQGRSGLFAALALTPPAGGILRSDDDGFLRLFEIYGLDMTSDLAVLSACGSHTGAQVEGEGVFALSRGVVAAGASRVVASQWPVDDASTAALMGDLFRRIAAGEKAGGRVDFGTALLEAKRLVRRRDGWAAPYYWAPFVLTGIR